MTHLKIHYLITYTYYCDKDVVYVQPTYCNMNVTTGKYATLWRKECRDKGGWNFKWREM